MPSPALLGSHLNSGAPYCAPPGVASRASSYNISLYKTIVYADKRRDCGGFYLNGMGFVAIPRSTSSRDVGASPAGDPRRGAIWGTRIDVGAQPCWRWHLALCPVGDLRAQSLTHSLEDIQHDRPTCPSPSLALLTPTVNSGDSP